MDKLIITVGALVVLVNIITEVAKNVSDQLSSSKVINTFVLVISIVLTLIAYFFLAHFGGYVVDVYGIIAAVVVGIMVSFSAMFGFDKLLVYLEPFIKGE